MLSSIMRTHRNSLHLLLLLSFIIARSWSQTQYFSPSSPTCGPNFPSACFCGREMYQDQLKYIVNCTNAGLQNTSVLEYMPDEVEILIFTGNLILELPWNVFGSINEYKNLTVVDMGNNHIREIRGKTYHHVKNVQRLLLNNNNISISRYQDEVNHHHPRVFSNFLNLQSLHLTNAFDDHSYPHLSADLHDIFVNSKLDKLQKLHLEQNEITHFDDRRVFCELPSLRDLHLGDNYLRDINFDVGCLKNLRFLDLERNKFEFVKTQDMILLNDLDARPNRTTNLVVDFNLNPFTCDCRIGAFRTWMLHTNVTVRNKESLMCYHDKVEPLPLLALNMGECASAVEAAATLFNTNSQQHYGEELHAKAHTSLRTHAQRHTAALIFLLVVLSMVLLVLIVALAYLSREKIRHMITPVLDNVSKKVQYTSIRDEDCPEVHV